MNLAQEHTTYFLIRRLWNDNTIVTLQDQGKDYTSAKRIHTYRVNHITCNLKLSFESINDPYKVCFDSHQEAYRIQI